MSDGLTIFISGSAFMLSIYIICTTFSILSLKKKYGSIENLVDSLLTQDWARVTSHELNNEFLPKIKVSKLRIVNLIITYRIKRKLLVKITKK